jgi:hypothetical protein
MKFKGINGGIVLFLFATVTSFRYDDFIAYLKVKRLEEFNNRSKSETC